MSALNQAIHMVKHALIIQLCSINVL